jgi:hypothetical protein
MSNNSWLEFDKDMSDGSIWMWEEASEEELAKGVEYLMRGLFMSLLSGNGPYIMKNSWKNSEIL